MPARQPPQKQTVLSVAPPSKGEEQAASAGPSAAAAQAGFHSPGIARQRRHGPGSGDTFPGVEPAAAIRARSMKPPEAEAEPPTSLFK